MSLRRLPRRRPGKSLLAQLNALGRPEAIYLVFVGAIALSSFAFILQPFVTFTLVLIYLISPVPSFLDVRYSAAITALLIGNCFTGCVLVGKFKNLCERRFLRIPAMLCFVAGLSAVYGLWRGNQSAFVLG